jgi:mannose/cellobiose epimerase-like protein (N-acyl-D-glucosamine 2-epimerase family)
VLDWHAAHATVIDGTNHCYGLAFVLLAHAHALMAGQVDAAAGLERCWQLMEQRFWQPEHALYADEATPDWVVGPYRGQNANMHACEAMMAAFRATRDRKYLDRAIALAESVTAKLAAKSADLAGVIPECAFLVWEHFKEDWSIDPDYNRDDRTNIFRPWGFQTGHQTEWTKLLLQLDRLCADAGLAPEPARLARARALFDAAMRFGWDAAHGGLVYGFKPDGTLYDDGKYHWVQAESMASAAWLAIALEQSGASREDVAHYWSWYDKIWNYAWANFVDHKYGAWYRVLAADNSRITDEKSPAGKVDYHDMGACYDVLSALRDI